MKKKSLELNLDETLHTSVKVERCKSKNKILIESGVSPWDLTPNSNSIISSLSKEEQFQKYTDDVTPYQIKNVLNCEEQ